MDGGGFFKRTIGRHGNAFRADADQSAPDQAQRRRADHAEQRHAIVEQGDVDGKFVAAVDEFLGAVERVDQEEAAIECWCRHIGALFGQSGDAGRQPRQPIGDDAVGRQIGLGDRRAVGLAVHTHPAAVDRQDRRTGLGHQFGQRLQQRCHRPGIECRSA